MFMPTIPTVWSNNYFCGTLYAILSYSCVEHLLEHICLNMNSYESFDPKLISLLTNISFIYFINLKISVFKASGLQGSPCDQHLAQSLFRHKTDQNKAFVANFNSFWHLFNQMLRPLPKLSTKSVQILAFIRIFQNKRIYSLI